MDEPDNLDAIGDSAWAIGAVLDSFENTVKKIGL